MSYLKKEFGKNLRLLRKSRNLTQEKLAEKLDLNQRQLTRIENGVSFVSSDVLEKLVVALNVDIKELFDFNLKDKLTDENCNNLSESKTNNDYKDIEIFIEKLKKIQQNSKYKEYINLAFDSLTNKDARKKLKNMLEGMELLD